MWKEESIEPSICKLGDDPNVELIFAMAHGDDVTALPANIKSSRSEKGRAVQMNSGAKSAAGSILLFLHADTSITPQSLVVAREALSMPGVAGGAYRLHIESASVWIRFVSFMANARSKIMKLPYGDQAIFLKRETFEKIGGYELVPMLEDVRLVEAIKREGKLIIINDRATTSARRWRKGGAYLTTARNWSIMIGYFAGISPARLDRIFRR